MNWERFCDNPSRKRWVMRSASLLVASMVLTVLCACAPITEQDLLALKTPNSILKKAAIQRISKAQAFPGNLIYRFVDQKAQKQAVAAMLAMLRGGKETRDVQFCIVKALGELGKRTDVPDWPFIQYLKDTDPKMMDAAIEALGKTKKKEAVGPLLKLLEHRTEHDNIVIWALGEIGDDKAIRTLNAFLSSKDEFLRYNAAMALAKIGAGDQDEDMVTTHDGASVKDSSLRAVGQGIYVKYQNFMIGLFLRISSSNNA